MLTQEHELNETAFRRLEISIAQTYPKGQYVAFVGGEIVADSADFFELHERLRAAGKDPFKAFIIQAGHKYPREGIILLDSPRRFPGPPISDITYDASRKR